VQCRRLASIRPILDELVDRETIESWERKE
jgi:hypothetical protein